MIPSENLKQKLEQFGFENLTKKIKSLEGSLLVKDKEINDLKKLIMLLSDLIAKEFQFLPNGQLINKP